MTIKLHHIYITLNVIIVMQLLYKINMIICHTKGKPSAPPTIGHVDLPKGGPQPLAGEGSPGDFWSRGGWEEEGAPGAPPSSARSRAG